MESGYQYTVLSEMWPAGIYIFLIYTYGVCEIRPQVTLDLISNSSSYLQGQTKQIERRIY